MSLWFKLLFLIKKGIPSNIEGMPFYLVWIYAYTIRYHQTLNLKNVRSLIDPFLVVIIQNNGQEDNKLARSNHQFNKCQKKITIKRKKEQKRQHKLDKNTIKSDES